MLWSLNGLRHYKIRATDKSLGSVEDLYFHDDAWTVRYLVVDTAWLLGRRVLLSAAVLGHPDALAREFPVALDEAAVRNSPDIDMAQPVSRQQEIDLHGHYGWTPYWAASAWIPAAAHATAASEGVEGAGVAEEEEKDEHLRSGRELIGYAVGATDGDAGHVDDLLIDDDGWIVRYLVVDTRHWLSGRKVLLSPDWVGDFSWADRRVMVAVAKGEIESSPLYDPTTLMERDYEYRLHQHYRREGYWA